MNVSDLSKVRFGVFIAVARKVAFQTFRPECNCGDILELGTVDHPVHTASVTEFTKDGCISGELDAHEVELVVVGGRTFRVGNQDGVRTVTLPPGLATAESLGASPGRPLPRIGAIGAALTVERTTKVTGRVVCHDPFIIEADSGRVYKCRPETWVRIPTTAKEVKANG